MKKALVLGVLILGLGVAAYASPVTGSWSTYFRLDTPTAIALDKFISILDVNYTVSGWTFGSTAVWKFIDGAPDVDGFTDLFFKAQGTLGAFSFKSVVDFDPTLPAFRTWSSLARVTIAGLDAFAEFAVKDFSATTTPQIGTGAVLGFTANAGDLKFLGMVNFNAADNFWTYWYYGIDYAASMMWYNSSCNWPYGNWYSPTGGYLADVQTAGCTLAWSSATFGVEFPFACIDVLAYISFSCTKGFEGFGFWLTGIDIGLGWLELSELDIDFTIDSKSLFLYWDAVLGDSVCITPYVTFEGVDGGYSIEAITLNALTLSYSFNGVTFKAGEIFDDTWRGGHLSSTRDYGFSMTGGITYTCEYNDAYTEFFGVVIDGDSCCGGAFNVGVYAFFDPGATAGIFDFQEVIGQVKLGIGSNTTLYFGASLLFDGLNWVELGVKFAW